jgi:N-carbamoylputrescine amidase
VLSGELVVGGYVFEPAIGTRWIEAQPCRWLTGYASLCRMLNVAAFVSHPERTDAGLFNGAFVIGRDGRILGSHRKLSPTPGSEDWSMPGTQTVPVMIDGLSVGMLICADLYAPEPAEQLRQRGADLIVSLAAWRPGPFGPAGEWEQRSMETGLPVIVCNRTGTDPMGDFSHAVSAVVANGERVIEVSSPTSAVYVVDLTLDDATVRAELVDTLSLDGG